MARFHLTSHQKSLNYKFRPFNNVQFKNRNYGLYEKIAEFIFRIEVIDNSAFRLDRGRFDTLNFC